MGESFWGVQEGIPEPKRKFRWVMRSSLGPTWVVKTVTKPSWTLGQAEVNYINHQFKYPGRITWEDIEVTLLDPSEPDTASSLMGILGLSGYRFPTDPMKASHTITKEASVRAVGSRIAIEQIGVDETDVLERWDLVNPWIKSVKMGELTYEDDGMVDLSATIVYDYAFFEVSPSKYYSEIVDEWEKRVKDASMPAFLSTTNK